MDLKGLQVVLKNEAILGRTLFFFRIKPNIVFAKH